MADKELDKAIQQLASLFDVTVGYVEEQMEIIISLEDEVGKAFQTNLEPTLFENTYYTDHRPSVEIKKELKHEKNPMRIKQLNRELNESYMMERKENAKHI